MVRTIGAVLPCSARSWRVWRPAARLELASPDCAAIRLDRRLPVCCLPVQRPAGLGLGHRPGPLPAAAAGPAGASLGANILLVWAVLYAVRGLAVFSAGSSRVPGPVIATLTVIAMFLLAVRCRRADAARARRHLARFPASTRDAGHLRARSNDRSHFARGYQDAGQGRARWSG